jgi:hypothetical protein
VALTSRSDRVDVKNISSSHVIPKANGLVLQSLYAVYSKQGYVVICRKTELFIQQEMQTYSLTILFLTTSNVSWPWSGCTYASFQSNNTHYVVKVTRRVLLTLQKTSRHGGWLRLKHVDELSRTVDSG